jgi:hypothetical protein
MGLWDKLRQWGNALRKLRLSLGPDSYYQYKRTRKYDQKQAVHDRAEAQDSAEREREETARDAARERDYEQRYARERERDNRA